LHLESIRGPGVFVHHDASAVSYGFKTTSYGNDNGECANFGLPSYDELGEEANGEEDEEKSVASEIGIVSIGCPFDRTLRCYLCAVLARHDAWRCSASIWW
jgi:hypothetical protein